MFVKLPIVLVDSRQEKMGLKDVDELQAYGYFNPAFISLVRQSHDDTLGDEPINNEATMIHLCSGDSFYIPLFIDDVLKLLQCQ